jgi:hypothetical protein
MKSGDVRFLGHAVSCILFFLFFSFVMEFLKPAPYPIGDGNKFEQNKGFVAIFSYSENDSSEPV